jgi:hypothetical protein
VNRPASVLLAALLAALYVVLFLTAITGHVGGVFASAVAILIVDVLLTWIGDVRLAAVLGAVSAGISWRVFVRDALIVVLLFRVGALSSTALGVVVAAVLAQHGVFSVHTAVTGVIRGRRLRRLETRNLAVPGDTLPPAPPDLLLGSGGRLLLQSDVLLIAALGAAYATGSYRWMAPAAVAMVVVAALVPLLLLPQAIALLRLPDDELRLRAAQRAVLGYRPLVILYFTGGVDSVYQVNMWLTTMERLDRPVLVLLRERRYLDQVAETSVPVLCLPFSVDLMNFEMPSVRVALYVANVGRNIHLLREPGMKSAFIGHGDSDKVSSFNPFTKVYDEVWVAGEAGRQRYARADVGVRADEIVLVGRPQLDAIAEATPRPAGTPYTVLYAPTWEGWTQELNQSSVLPMGTEIVRTLLATPRVRVIYKPHPLTGTVDNAAGAASDALIALIKNAGGPHFVVADNSRALYDLFNESDALISDVSSVVSDYLRSEKPYFVTNPAGLPDATFRDVNPSAGAAYLIGPGGTGLSTGLEAARGADEMRVRRHQVRAYLLGDPALDPMTLFRDAVDALAAKARPVAADSGDDLRAAARVEDESAGEHESERMSRSASVD